MSTSNELEIPDRIKSLISVNDLENSITEQKDLLNLPPNTIFGIGKRYARKLKQKAKSLKQKNLNELKERDKSKIVYLTKISF